MNDILLTILTVIYLFFVTFFIAKKNQVLKWSFSLFFVSIIAPTIFLYDKIWWLAGFGMVVIFALIEDKVARPPLPETPEEAAEDAEEGSEEALSTDTNEDNADIQSTKAEAEAEVNDNHDTEAQANDEKAEKRD